MPARRPAPKLNLDTSQVRIRVHCALDDKWYPGWIAQGKLVCMVGTVSLTRPVEIDVPRNNDTRQEWYRSAVSLLRRQGYRLARAVYSDGTSLAI